ncbi:hypothetical protein PoB_005358300 [Plakobranchus ocellatus]|uniref:Uncharacterized protein n=1 Tax=Plakobranchus ocellatus TaxID=259542 RepID=A0AAV4C6J0_9GAST|nr:hypothetical protein PoB_005358300 [Plakobranchus ocellatus]
MEIRNANEKKKKKGGSKESKKKGSRRDKDLEKENAGKCIEPEIAQEFIFRIPRANELHGRVDVIKNNVLLLSLYPNHRKDGFRHGDDQQKSLAPQKITPELQLIIDDYVVYSLNAKTKPVQTFLSNGKRMVTLRVERPPLDLQRSFFRKFKPTTHALA